VIIMPDRMDHVRRGYLQTIVSYTFGAFSIFRSGGKTEGGRDASRPRARVSPRPHRSPYHWGRKTGLPAKDELMLLFLGVREVALSRVLSFLCVSFCPCRLHLVQSCDVTSCDVDVTSFHIGVVSPTSDEIGDVDSTSLGLIP
jgi:hypothetical protein